MKETILEYPILPKIAEKKTNSYFKERMKLLGITPGNNSIKLWENVNENNEHKDVLVDRPIFRELPEGIEIIVYTLEGKRSVSKKWKPDEEKFFDNSPGKTSSKTGWIFNEI